MIAFTSPRLKPGDEGLINSSYLGDGNMDRIFHRPHGMDPTLPTMQDQTRSEAMS